MIHEKTPANAYDIVIVGGGIVGAATLYQLQQRYPDRSMLLVEKEAELAGHQTGNNSGVIHSGLYYPPGSLKAKNCVEGRRALVRFAQEHNVPHDVCGKVVVAVESSEMPMLEKIHGIGQQNEIEGLERIDGDQLREIEPHCKGVGALWVPCTGIIDYRSATRKMVELALGMQPKSAMRLGEEVTSFERTGEDTRRADESVARRVLGEARGGLWRSAGGSIGPKRRGAIERASGRISRRLLRIDRAGQAQSKKPNLPRPQPGFSIPRGPLYAHDGW